MIDKGSKNWGNHFQTPPHICKYMASFLPKNAGLILEPTPGKGNLVKVLKQYGKVVAPKDFDKLRGGGIRLYCNEPAIYPNEARLRYTLQVYGYDR